jgi:AcrR family transcriptional regulator
MPHTSSLAARLHAPLQNRSRATMERVLDTFIAMLAERPFAAITMAELARRSGAAVTSIYARFADKQALVLAAHERHREDVMRQVDQRLDPERWRGKDLETIARECLRSMIDGWWRKVPLIRAALLANDREINERAALMLRHTSAKLAALLGPHLTWLKPPERERTIDFAFRGVMAVMHQRLAFGDIEPVRFRLSEAEMGERLTAQFLAVLNASRRKPAAHAHRGGH